MRYNWCLWFSVFNIKLHVFVWSDSAEPFKLEFPFLYVQWDSIAHESNTFNLNKTSIIQVFNLIFQVDIRQPF